MSIYERLNAIWKPKKQDRAPLQTGLWEELGFAFSNNRAGTFLVREVPALGIRIEDGATAYIWGVIGKNHAPREPELGKMCFIDLETTGLNLGAGAFAFTIGIGYLDSGKAKVRQYFLRDHRDEPAALHDLREFMEQFEGIVSYNGKCFDWPLLSDRFLFHRMSVPELEGLHLDLLHAARRVWKGVLNSFSLREVERCILGLERIDDLPGYLVPAAYANFLRTGSTREIPPILEHNYRDIASLIELLQRLGRVFLGADQCCYRQEVVNAARIWADKGDYVRATDYLENYLAQGGDLTASELCFLARLHKRQGDYERAVELWEKTAATAGLNSEPWIELAKYYEHRRRDYPSARQCALRAMEIERQLARLTGRDTEHSDLAKRLARLETKLGKRELRIKN